MLIKMKWGKGFIFCEDMVVFRELVIFEIGGIVSWEILYFTLVLFVVELLEFMVFFFFF